MVDDSARVREREKGKERERKRERLYTFTSSSVANNSNNCGNCKENLTDCSQVVAGVGNGLAESCRSADWQTVCRQMSALTFKTGECSRQQVCCLSLLFFR